MRISKEMAFLEDRRDEQGDTHSATISLSSSRAKKSDAIDRLSPPRKIQLDLTCSAQRTARTLSVDQSPKIFETPQKHTSQTEISLNRLLSIDTVEALWDLGSIVMGLLAQGSFSDHYLQSGGQTTSEGEKERGYALYSVNNYIDTILSTRRDVQERGEIARSI